MRFRFMPFPGLSLSPHPDTGPVPGLFGPVYPLANPLLYSGYKKVHVRYFCLEVHVQKRTWKGDDVLSTGFQCGRMHKNGH